MKFAIGIPTLNRFDYLLPSLIIYANDFPDVNIYVIDNGKQGIKEDSIIKNISNLTILEQDENLGVARSWNKLCDIIFKDCDFALILNDDILLGRKKAEIESLLRLNQLKTGIIRSTIDWCAFIMPKFIFDKVGRFDECFYPAYYEDASYQYRMKLMGYVSHTTPILNPSIYQSSKTLEKMPSILRESRKNKQRYIEMWGGLPEREKYKTPYNE